MNYFDKFEERSCLNKIPYKTRELAEQAYKAYRRNMQRNRGRRVNRDKNKQYPYKCIYCGNWHLTTR